MMEYVKLFFGCIGGHCITELNPSNSLIYLNIFAIIDTYRRIPQNISILTSAPISDYVVISLLYLIIMYINANVWQYSISASYQILIRSCSLLIHILIDKIIGNHISRRKFFEAMFLFLGFILVSYDNDIDKLSTSLIGLSLTFASMLSSIWLGIMQTKLYKQYKCNSDELILITHSLGLPFMIYQECFNYSSNKPLIETHIYSIVYGLLQYICVRSVYDVHSKTDSYHLNIILIIRKALSILLSKLYYGTFGILGVIGAILIFSVAAFSSRNDHKRKYINNKNNKL